MFEVWLVINEAVFKREGEAPAEPRAFQNAVTISGSAGASPSRNASKPIFEISF